MHGGPSGPKEIRMDRWFAWRQPAVIAAQAAADFCRRGFRQAIASKRRLIRPLLYFNAPGWWFGEEEERSPLLNGQAARNGRLGSRRQLVGGGKDPPQPRGLVPRRGDDALAVRAERRPPMWRLFTGGSAGRPFLRDRTWIEHFDQRCPIRLSRGQRIRRFLRSATVRTPYDNAPEKRGDRRRHYAGIESDSADERRGKYSRAASNCYTRSQDELTAVFDLGIKLVDALLKVHDLLVRVALSFVGIQILRS